MNEKTTELVNTVLEKSIKLAEKTGDFVVTQSPELVEQLLNWRLTEAIIALILGITVIIIGLIIAKTITKTFNINNTDYRPNCILSYAGIGGLSLLIAIAIWDTNNIFDIFKIIIAPKLFLLEFAAGLAK